VTGYLHPGYPESLAEFGRPRELPRSGGWLLERGIPGSDLVDAMGCYPLFVCHDWSRLPLDLADLQGELVSVSLVTDPFGDFDRQLLDACFDTVSPFKEHYVADLSETAETIVSKHHRGCALRALQDVSVEVCHEPRELLEEWIALYEVLIEKHAIHGIPAFSRAAFARQLTVPGIVALRAKHQGATVAANLFYVQGAIAYDHLTASSPEGYRLRASYALKWSAMKYFVGRVRWIGWGGGAGIARSGSDGLTVFKSGWARQTRPVYHCGRILDKGKYGELTQARRLESSAFFPAYRHGEFI
jgi:hypothetical protein